MSNRLFTTYKFEYTVPKELLSMPITTDKLSVEATLCNLCEGIAPVITISFRNISILDIVNITNWALVKKQCEDFARCQFGTNTNVIVPVNPHYNMPTE